MKALRSILLAGATLALAVGGALAQQTISLNVLNGATSIGSVSNVTGGAANISGNDGTFVWSLSALGSPIVPQPSFATVNLSASSATGGTLTFLATQQGLDSFSGSLLSAFAADFLINNTNVGGVLMQNWIDPTNTAFGLGQLLDSQLCFGAANNCAPPSTTVAGLNLTGPFSETELFVITFNGVAGVSGNSQISAAVPEPATWGMMLLGFMGLGVAFRNRRRMASLAA